MADDPSTPPVVQGDPAPGNPPNPTPAPAGDPPAGDPLDVAGYKRALDASRAEADAAKRDAKAAAKALEAAQAEVKKHADAEKTDLERAVAHAEEAERARADLETKHRTALIRHAVSVAARDAHFANPEIVYRLLDTSAIEFDDTGDPVGIADAVKALAKTEPWMLVAENGRAGPPPTEKTGRPANAETPEEERARREQLAAQARSSF